MKGIRSIVIDDETGNRGVLTHLLKKHCPSIELIGEGTDLQNGYGLITAIEPELVFLPIQMFSQKALDIFLTFNEMKFQVIFVAAFDSVLLQTFEFCAINHLLKPIDYTNLTRSKETLISDEIHFIRSNNEKEHLLKNIVIHRKDKVTILDVDAICYVQAAGNYCEVITDDNQRLVSAKTLSDFEALLQSHSCFLRISKSFLVNVRYIRDYSKGGTCFMSVKNCTEYLEVSRRKKSEVLRYLKKQTNDIVVIS